MGLFGKFKLDLGVQFPTPKLTYAPHICIKLSEILFASEISPKKCTQSSISRRLVDKG